MSVDVKKRSHLKNLVKEYTKRLCVLQLKEARLGVNTPPEVIIESKECEKRISEIKEELANMNGILKEKVPSKKKSKIHHEQKKVIVSITFKGEYDLLTTKEKDAIMMAIAAIADISLDQIILLDTSPGSIVFQLQMPEDAATRLLDAIKSGDPVIRDIGIYRIELMNFEDKYRKLGLEIRKLRYQQRMTTEQLQDKMQFLLLKETFDGNLSENDPIHDKVVRMDWLWRIENGEAVKTSAKELYLLASALGLTPKERYELIRRFIVTEFDLRLLPMDIEKAILQVPLDEHYDHIRSFMEQVETSNDTLILEEKQILTIMEPALRAAIDEYIPR